MIDIIKETGNEKNIFLEQHGEEFWVFDRFWSQDEPIVKLKNWKDLPAWFVVRQVNDWSELFWEECECLEVDLKEIG